MEPLTIKLKVCTSITSWLFYFKSIIMVYKSKCTKTQSVSKYFLTWPCLSVCLSIYLWICTVTEYLYISECLSIQTSIYLSIYLSIRLTSLPFRIKATQIHISSSCVHFIKCMQVKIWALFVMMAKPAVSISPTEPSVLLPPPTGHRPTAPHTLLQTDVCAGAEREDRAGLGWFGEEGSFTGQHWGSVTPESGT